MVGQRASSPLFSLLLAPIPWALQLIMMGTQAAVKEQNNCSLIRLDNITSNVSCRFRSSRAGDD